MCTAVNFEASFDCEQTFCHGSIRKTTMVEKSFSLTFVDSFQNFSSGCANNNKELGFATPLGLPGEAVGSFSGYAVLYVGGLAKVLLRCNGNIFQSLLPFAIFYYDFHHLENCLDYVSPENTQHVLSIHVTSGLREMFFVRVF